jgi:DNA primase
VISHFNISRVLAATDMLDLANSYATKPLKKVGAQWVGSCPFHSEKTPSFYISASREWWHCKGACGKGGSAIDFVMAIERLSFPDAVRLLAAKANIDLGGPAEPVKDAYARQLAKESAWFWERQGIKVEDPEKALKEYYEFRTLNPHLTVRQFQEERKLEAECLRVETAAAGMVGDLFPESFDELIYLIGSHFE